jgi:hypothetical protein
MSMCERWRECRDAMLQERAERAVAQVGVEAL